MGDKKGSKNLDDWLIINEAEVDELEAVDSFEDLFENSGSDISDLIDDSVLDQGNSLALFREQTEACDAAIIKFLKRKQTPSPEQESVAALSPRLASVSISASGGHKSKRKLFDDSGIENDEIEDRHGTQVETETDNASFGVAAPEPVAILRSSNKNATLLAKFKECFEVSFTEITRVYKSEKSTCVSWVVAAMQQAENILEAAKTLLQQHTVYLQMIMYGFNALYLLEFKVPKSKSTVRNMFSTMLNINEELILLNPPKIKSVPVALYFWKKSLSNVSYQHGEVPDWITQQTMVCHQMGAQPENFELAQMIQWAYDNEMVDEGSIAYNYAAIAHEDKNAMAWLKSNQHAKYVRDCAYMVQLIKRQEMKEMSMPAWIHKCCNAVPDEEGDWKTICHFLKYQGVNIVAFLGALRLFFKCTPKKQCIVFYGPSDTGKSMFAFSLIKFLCGKVISYANSQSHFWLQPLRDCKVALLDDATYSCWQYIDVYLRTALDGHPVSMDAKHKNPFQMKVPPMFITTNVDVMQDQTLMYLHSRVQVFAFPNKVPLNAEGESEYRFTDKNWKFFFRKLTKQLDLTYEDGEADRTFRFDTRGITGDL
ncbi:early protein 1 [Callithrix penicillata papillomavirus type 1]|uniref:Replication protein E1 n=1 Tax=Callithrix penicillata papillomavirus type 1 TaxID=2704503 RepID=A0A6C0T9K2_9PAPI|nr:early protein 1 [Callithrix penicillata papillomavirus type 1]